jgi:hypothetical protein
VLRTRDTVLFGPLIRDPDLGREKNPEPGFGMTIPDYFSESFFGQNIIKCFDADPNPEYFDLDPGSGFEKFGFGIRYIHPGSATLLDRYLPFEKNANLQINGTHFNVLQINKTFS